MPSAVADAEAIRRAAGDCLRRVALDRKLRLLGVRVGALIRAGNEVVSEPGQRELPL